MLSLRHALLTLFLTPLTFMQTCVPVDDGKFGSRVTFNWFEYQWRNH